MARGFYRYTLLLFSVLALPWLLAPLTLDLAMHWFPGEWRVDSWRTAAISIAVVCGFVAAYVAWSVRWHWSVKIALTLIIMSLTAALSLTVLLQHESCGEAQEFIELKLSRSPRSLVCS